MADKSESKQDQRACDGCRTRKVKCDKGSPCSNCKSSKSICRTTTTQNSEPRSRIVISKEYEKKIDFIGDRLTSIEKLLQQQRGSAIETAVRREDSPRAAPITPSSVATSELKPLNSYHVGDVGAGPHSAVASSVIEQAVGESAGAYGDVELAAALRSLKDMVGHIEETSDHTDFTGFREEGKPMEPPDETDIERLLQNCQNSFTLVFSPGLTVSALREKCGSVFTPGQRPSAIRRVYVHGVLRSLCNEYGGLESGSAFAQRCHNLRAFFTAQLGQAVNDITLVMPATEEAGCALIRAAVVAEELCKPHLALTLTSNAASMVLSLGYHRISTMQSDTETDRQSKILLFWMTYWLDTSFAVRLGRAPVIRSYDITVPRLSHGSILPSSFLDAFNYCTRVSALQCKVVEELYSPLALQQSSLERAKRASELVEHLQVAWTRREEAPSSVADHIGDPGLYLLMKESDAAMHYSTLALVQHATISAASNESPALDAARNALSLHTNTWRTYRHLPDFIWTGHCHWGLLKAPITPFTVLFCHIIAHSSTAAAAADLRLMADFVATLRELRRFAAGMAKLHALCDIFCKVATLYVQAKANETLAGSSWSGQPTVNEIDTYLETIGFAAAPLPDPNAILQGNDAFDPDFLNDWFQGNSFLIGFLEQQDMLLPE